MDGIANVAKQQVQANIHDLLTKNGSVTPVQGSSNDAIAQQNKEMIKDENQVKQLVNDLNEAIEILHTSLKFGVDKENVFYVSVIDKKTDKMIRRWPAEEAKSILPKMKELTGILFDTKG